MIVVRRITALFTFRVFVLNGNICVRLHAAAITTQLVISAVVGETTLPVVLGYVSTVPIFA
jgi:hypothetical protein